MMMLIGTLVDDTFFENILIFCTIIFSLQTIKTEVQKWKNSNFFFFLQIIDTAETIVDSIYFLFEFFSNNTLNNNLHD